MKLSELCEKLSLTVVAGETNLDAAFDGVYAGDLLSRAMSHVEAENLWITIMSNVNVVAVSTLADVASVILAEGVTLDDEVLEVERTKGVNVISTDLSAYEAALAVAALIK